MGKKLKPKPGETYTDSEGRVLTVTEVHPNDPLGREVVGRLDADFSTTIEQWRETWRDRKPRIPYDEMRIG